MTAYISVYTHEGGNRGQVFVSKHHNNNGVNIKKKHLMSLNKY